MNISDKRPQNIHFMAIIKDKVTDTVERWDYTFTATGLSVSGQYKALIHLGCLAKKRKYEGENTACMMSSSCWALGQNKSSRHKTDFLKHTHNIHT